MHELLLVVAVKELNVKTLREVLPQVVRSPRLQGFAVLHHAFYRVRIYRPGETLGRCFLSLDHRHGHFLGGKLGIDVEHTHGFFACLGFVGMGSVAFLP